MNTNRIISRCSFNDSTYPNRKRTQTRPLSGMWILSIIWHFMYRFMRFGGLTNGLPMANRLKLCAFQRRKMWFIAAISCAEKCQLNAIGTENARKLQCLFFFLSNRNRFILLQTIYVNQWTFSHARIRFKPNYSQRQIQLYQWKEISNNQWTY